MPRMEGGSHERQFRPSASGNGSVDQWLPGGGSAAVRERGGRSIF